MGDKCPVGKYFARALAGTVGYIHIMELLHVGFYITGCHALSYPQDSMRTMESIFPHVLLHGIRVFFNELKLILTVTVARDCNIHVAIAGVHGLFRIPIATVVRVLVPVIVL